MKTLSVRYMLRLQKQVILQVENCPAGTQLPLPGEEVTIGGKVYKVQSREWIAEAIVSGVTINVTREL